MNAPRRLAVLLACVLSSGWLAAQTTFTWSGNATTSVHGYPFANAGDGANWVGGVAPTSSAQNTSLLFGASGGVGNGNWLNVELPYPGSSEGGAIFEVKGIAFEGPMPSYSFYVNDAALGIGADGITLNGYYYTQVSTGTTIRLLTSQTWAINNGSAYVHGNITEATTGTSLTKTGYGTLILTSPNSDFSGGLTLQGGTLYVGASSTLGEGITGPLGSGTLTLANNTRLGANSDDDVVLHNPVALGNNVTIDNSGNGEGLTLAGTITPQNPNTTINVGLDGALFIGQIKPGESGLTFQGGNIGNAAAGATQLTFRGYYGYSDNNDKSQVAATPTDSDYLPVVVLSGTNTYTGGTVADNAAVIFYTPSSLPAEGAISAYQGYVGTGYNGGMTAILSRISDKTTFNGALGFDTHPAAGTVNTFADTLDLSGFTPDSGDPLNGFWGLGSLTKAIITGAITPPTGGNYVFGGQEGTLYVQSNLTAATGVRVRTPYGSTPLTVWLRGTNSFTGNLLSDHSIVVLDSATALPNGSSFSLDSGAYVGYTENFTAGGSGTVTPAQFISRLAGTAYNEDSILGFDSANSSGRTISDPIDLSALNDIFIGTTTHVHLTGPIVAPSSGQLSVTGLNGGWLTLDRALHQPLAGIPVTNTPTQIDPTAVSSLNIGATNSDGHRRGIVEITSGDSTFSGGTTFNSGYLLLGASSTVDGTGAITKGPLGTGSLNLATNYNWDSPATIAATATGITLHNDINFSYGNVRFGVPTTSENDDPATRLQSYTGYGLTLNGNLTGSVSMLSFAGNGTFTLGGNNTGLSAYSVYLGNNAEEGTPLVVAKEDNSLGFNSSFIYLGSGSDLKFESAAPTVGSLSGGYTYADNTNRSFIALAADSTLTINQHSEGYLYANIGGTPENFSNSNTTAVNASLIKNGTGTLVLAGDNTYSGGTTVRGGLLLAGSNVVRGEGNQIVSGPFGTGTVTLDGGGVGAVAGYTLANPISFGTAGGTLGGSGTIASAITAGTNVTIAPGNSPGQLTFTSNLTFASGGVASFDISNFAGTAGSGWDQIVVSDTGAFALTATIANPFTIQINSWSELGNSLGALTTDFSAPASLAILQTSTPITGLLGNGQAGSSNLVLNTGNFTAYQPGEFSLSLSTDSTALLLNFTPVPEPSTYALFGAGLLLVAGSVWRSKRARRD